MFLYYAIKLLDPPNELFAMKVFNYSIVYLMALFAFLLADHCGLLLRPELSQFAGYALYQDPVRNRLRLSQFEQAWATSISDADLRSFLL